MKKRIAKLLLTLVFFVMSPDQFLTAENKSSNKIAKSCPIHGQDKNAKAARPDATLAGQLVFPQPCCCENPECEENEELLESILDCCSTVNSKIDILLTHTVSISVTVDFSGTFTALAACCSTLNSKIDVINGNIINDFGGTFTFLAMMDSQLVEIQSDVDSILNCCSTVNSKVDVLQGTVVNDFGGTFTVLNTILNAEINGFCGTFTALAACCSTLNSKVDVLNGTVVNDFGGTFTFLKMMDSQLVEIQSDVDSILNCCSTVNSKIDVLQITVTTDFHQTLTVLGSLTDTSTGASSPIACLPFPGTFGCPPFTTAAQVDAANLDVIQWLKTLYRAVIGSSANYLN